MAGESADNYAIYYCIDTPEQPLKVEKVVPEDKLEEHQIKIKVKACSLSQPPYEICSTLGISKLPVGLGIVGTVVSCGEKVEHLEKGQRCFGILPIDSGQTGCSEYVILNDSEIAHGHGNASSIEVAGVLDCGVEAVTALHYLAHVNKRDSVLVMDGASSTGRAAIQIAHHFGCQVMATYSTDDERAVLNTLKQKLTRSIDMSIRGNILVKHVMEQTGGEGVNVIIDNGISGVSASKEEPGLPHQQDLINCLSVRGRWITRQPHLQLDPPQARLLWLRSASLSFLNPHTWTLSGSDRGRYQHVLALVMGYLNQGVLEPHIHHTVSCKSECGDSVEWASLCEVLRHELEQQHTIGSIVVEF